MNETLYERRSISSEECVNQQPFDNKAPPPLPEAALSYLSSRYLSILIPFLIGTLYHICSHYASSLVYKLFDDTKHYTLSSPQPVPDCCKVTVMGDVNTGV